MITHAPKNYIVKSSLEQIENSSDFANLEDVVGFYYGGAEGLMINNGPTIMFYTRHPQQPYLTKRYMVNHDLYLEYVIRHDGWMQDLTFSLTLFTKLSVFNDSHPLYNTKTKNIYLSKNLVCI